MHTSVLNGHYLFQDMRVTLYPGANQRPNHRIDHTKEDEVAIG